MQLCYQLPKPKLLHSFIQSQQFLPMFVIVFSNEQSQKKIAPLLVPIPSDILHKQCSYLQQLAYTHFRDHLSPFIRKQHLELATQKQIMKPDYPIFIYCNFKQYLSNIICTLKPFEEEVVLKRSYLLKNSIVVVNSKDYSEKIFKSNQMERFDKIVGDRTSVYICGRQIQLLPKQSINQQLETPRKWSQFITQKRNKFQSPNYCLYVMI